MTADWIVPSDDFIDRVNLLAPSPITNGAEPDEPDSWQPIDLTTLPDQPPIRPNLGPIPIVYPGKRHVFSGAPESGKTLAAYAIGIHVIRHHGPLILIDFEMGAYDARDRLYELGATPAELQARLRYLEPAQPATEDRINRLIALQPALVIIDAAAGAYDLEGLDDNKRGDVERLSRLYVRLFWRHGIATIFIDHVVKNAETRGKWTIGSERKLGGADVHLGFETITPISRGTHGRYKIVTHKDRGGYLPRGKLADLDLHSDPLTHFINWEFKPAEHEPADRPQLPTILMERVSRTLEIATEPFSRRQIATFTKGNDAWLVKATDHLVSLGYATETSGPRDARLFTSTGRFRADEYESQTTNNPDLCQPLPTSASPLPGRGLPTSADLCPPFKGQSVAEADVEAEAEPPPLPTQSSWLDDLAATVDLDQQTGTLDDTA